MVPHISFDENGYMQTGWVTMGLMIIISMMMVLMIQIHINHDCTYF